MMSFIPLRYPLSAAAALACVCPAQVPVCPAAQVSVNPATQEDVVVLNGPEDMLSLWDDMCLNLRERARVRISPAWRVTPKQAIDVTMQDLRADSYGCDYEPATGIITIRPRYSSMTRLIAAHRNPDLLPRLSDREKQALAVAERWVEELIRPGMSDYEKVLALHDRVNAHTEFVRPEGDDCTAMFLTGKGVCEGYARGLHVLFTLAGVPNRFAFGIARGENHLWNLVCVDGLWYHLDATWDDGMVGYGFFLLTDDELAVDHRFDRRRFHATAETGHLYYRRNGLAPDSYPAMWEGVLKAWEDGAESYQCYFPAFTNRATFRKELQSFRETHPEVALLRWTGSGDKECILTVFFKRTSK